MWNKGDVPQYANTLSKELSKIVLPRSALTCNGTCQFYCFCMIDQYFRDIVQCLISASNRLLFQLKTLCVRNIGGMKSLMNLNNKSLMLQVCGELLVVLAEVQLKVIDCSANTDINLL